MRKNQLLVLVLLLILAAIGGAWYLLNQGPNVVALIPDTATNIVIGEFVPSPTEPYETQEITYDIRDDPLADATRGQSFLGTAYNGWYTNPKGYTLVGYDNFGDVDPKVGSSNVTVGIRYNDSDPSKPDVTMLVRRKK